MDDSMLSAEDIHLFMVALLGRSTTRGHGMSCTEAWRYGRQWSHDIHTLSTTRKYLEWWVAFNGGTITSSPGPVDALGRPCFVVIDTATARPTIYVNTSATEQQRCFALAKAIGHCLLQYDHYFPEHSVAVFPDSEDLQGEEQFRDLQARAFAQGCLSRKKWLTAIRRYLYHLYLRWR